MEKTPNWKTLSREARWEQYRKMAEGLQGRERRNYFRTTRKEIEDVERVEIEEYIKQGLTEGEATALAEVELGTPLHKHLVPPANAWQIATRQLAEQARQKLTQKMDS